MKSFCFTVDDNIRFFQSITKNQPESLFDDPYLAMYKRLHDEFDLKVQLNLFYCSDEFDLSQMTDAYRDEWKEHSNWLKLSFHSRVENSKPYQFSGYDEVYNDCKAVHDQILRFASPSTLAKTTTIHCCLATQDGLKALAEHGVKGLLGLYGDEENPRTSYSINEKNALRLRNGNILLKDGINFAPIDVILNIYSLEEILTNLSNLLDREKIWLMIHEQYFYPDYKRYQPDFEKKLRETFLFLCQNGYKSRLFEDLI